MADVLTSKRHGGEPARPDRPAPRPARTPDTAARRRQRQAYPHWFYLPSAAVFVVIFVVPTAMAFFYAFTRWTLFDWEFIGLENFRQFFRQPALSNGLRNTVIYAVVTSGLKVVLGLALGVLVTSRIHLKGTLRSMIFFPVVVSTVAVGITFKVMMHPTDGLLNRTIALVGITGPDWLTDSQIALLSVALVDVWKGVGLAMVIYIAGILSIPQDLNEAVAVDGGGAWAQFRYLDPAAEPPGDLHRPHPVLRQRSPDLRPDLDDDQRRARLHDRCPHVDDLQAVPGGLLRPVHGRQHRAVRDGHGARLPLELVPAPPGAGAVKLVRRYWLDVVALVLATVVFVVPFGLIALTAVKDSASAARLDLSWPTSWHVWENISEVVTARDYMLREGHEEQRDPDRRRGDVARRVVLDGRLRARAAPRPDGEVPSTRWCWPA